MNEKQLAEWTLLSFEAFKTPINVYLIVNFLLEPARINHPGICSSVVTQEKDIIDLVHPE